MTLKEAAQQALAYIEQVDYGPYDARPVIDALRAALAEPVQPVAFFTEDNGFPQTFVSKDRQKQTIISLTEQCAALIRERNELQKQVWLYEKNGVTCQTYRHTVEQSCAECNVQANYTAPPQRKPLTDDAIVDIWAGVSIGYDDQINIIELARAIEAAHGIGDSNGS